MVKVWMEKNGFPTAIETDEAEAERLIKEEYPYYFATEEACAAMIEEIKNEARDEMIARIESYDGLLIEAYKHANPFDEDEIPYVRALEFMAKDCGIDLNEESDDAY